MKNFSNHLFFGILLLLTALTLSSCKKKNSENTDSNPLVGTWYAEEKFSNDIVNSTSSETFTLKADGSAVFVGKEEGVSNGNPYAFGHRYTGTYTSTKKIITFFFTTMEGILYDGTWGEVFDEEMTVVLDYELSEDGKSLSLSFDEEDILWGGAFGYKGTVTYTKK